MTKEMKRETIYHCGSSSMTDIIAELERILQEKGFVGKYIISRLTISSGLPHSDYGQTIEVEYYEHPKSYDIPNREMAAKVLIGS